jgi:hypothetical protein
VTEGTASAITATSTPGEFTATITPSGKDIEVGIAAHAHGVSVSKTALTITNIDSALGQPEAVPGLVNTTGIEDGENVSPDGQWLIVASYVPVDVYTCASKGLTMSDPSCSTIIGPYTAPERPSMLGSSRIHGGTYDSDCPSLGIATPQAFAFMPTAAYVFHRQADDSFAEPHVLGVQADGCLGPYGYSFAGAPASGTAGVVFANDDPFDSPDTKADLYFLSIKLGQDNLWGHYAVDNGSPKLSGMLATKLLPVLPWRQGNPAYQGGLLAWDNEDLDNAQRVIYFAKENGTMPNVSVADAGPLSEAGAATLGMNEAGQEHIQPAFDGIDLYWFGSSGIRRATMQSGADPAASASWSSSKVMLAPAQGGVVLATGEPTVANLPSGEKELYFVYIKTTSTGLDGAVGRVPFL